jgi:putative sigma-54 modulation protein
MTEKLTISGYSVTIHGRHVQVTQPIRDYILEKLGKVEKFSPHHIEATIVLEVQKLEHRVDIVLKFDQIKVKVHGISENMYASIDQAIVRLVSKVRKYKDRINEHHVKPKKETQVSLSVWGKKSSEEIFSDQIEELQAIEEFERNRFHEVVRREKKPLKTLNHDEAIMKMELSGDHFMIYKSEEDQKIRVIYLMSDGNFGVIEPES